MPSEGSFQEMKEKVVEEFEMAFLSELVSTHHGNISKAAHAAKEERASRIPASLAEAWDGPAGVFCGLGAVFLRRVSRSKGKQDFPCVMFTGRWA